MELPEDVLPIFAETHGLALAEKDGIFTLSHGAFPVAVVHSHPSGWPVLQIEQHHDDGYSVTGWTKCGPGHSPHIPRLHADDVRTPEQVAELERQKQDTPIDTPEKLLAVLEEILAHDHAAGVKMRNTRHVRQAEKEAARKATA